MPQPGTRLWLGLIYTAIIAMSFATNSAFAALAYREGASVLSVLTARSATAALSVLAVLLIFRVPLGMPAARRTKAIILGILLGGYSFSLLGAVDRIPVALAVLTFYLYPLLVGLGAWAFRQEKMTLGAFATLMAAFVGLALALNITGDGVDPIGFGMGVLAAVLITAVILLNAQWDMGADSRPVTFYILATATVFAIGGNLIAGEFPVPAPGPGLVYFLAVGVFYSFSIIGMFVVLRWVGSVRVGLVMNFEPVTSLALGAVMLGQFLSPVQFLGAAIVVVAIVIGAWRKAREAA